MQVLKCADFNPETFFYKAPKVKNRRGNPGKKARHYIGITTAFDIETSILPGTEQAFMYIWQWFCLPLPLHSILPVVTAVANHYRHCFLELQEPFWLQLFCY